MTNMKKLMDTLGKNIDYFMGRDDALYKTANALGVAAGISPNTIRYYIDPEKRPGYLRKKKLTSAPELDKLLAIAEKLNCEIWELLHPNIEQARKDRDAIKAVQASMREEPRPTERISRDAIRLTVRGAQPRRSRDKRHA